MKTMQDTKELRFNIMFSNNLVKQYDYYALKGLGQSGTPTLNGHGPFVELSSGGVIYDLRSYDLRWIFGNTHPLEIRAQIKDQLNELKDLTSTSIAKISSEMIQKNHSWNFPHSFLTSKVYIPKGYKIINTSIKEDFDIDLQSFINNGTRPLIYLNYQGCLINWTKIQNLFKIIYENNLPFGVIEENTLGFTNSDFVFTAFGQSGPSFVSSNFNLNTFINFSDELYAETISPYQLELFTSFTRLLYEGKMFGNQGHIERVSKYITKAIDSFQVRGFNQKYLQVICFDHSINLNELIQKGIIANEVDDKLYLCFPIAIKEEHILEVFEILKQQEN